MVLSEAGACHTEKRPRQHKLTGSSVPASTCMHQLCVVSQTLLSLLVGSDGMAVLPVGLVGGT